MSYIETEEYSEKAMIFLASVAYKNTKCSSDFILKNYVLWASVVQGSCLLVIFVWFPKLSVQTINTKT
jgi:hypothetical protein